MRRKPVLRRPGLALALRRHPRWRPVAAVALGLLSGGVALSSVQGAEDARAAWGQSVSVLVATRDLEAGERLDQASFRREAHPAPLVPDGALTELPAQARLATPVLAGEVLRVERLAPAGASALSARLPAGTRAVAIPVDPSTTPVLAVGDHVEVLVALPGEAAGGGPPGFALATDVPVVHVTDAAVTIAVDRDTAPRVAVAFGQGAVTLALLP